MRKKKCIERIIIYFIMITGAVLILLPIWTVGVTSLTSEAQIFLPGASMFPKKPTMENYRKLFDIYPFVHWYRNSLITTVLYTIGQIFSCSFTAFALAHFDFKGKKILIVFILSTMMLPFQVTMIPMFLIMNILGWTNTILPLIVPAFFGDVCGAIGIFLLYQAFLQLPKTLSEAAYIDGANPWKVFCSIYWPLSKPFVAVVVVLSFMTSWNDFSRPLVYISDIERMTVTGGLSFFRTEWQIEWGLTMAGTVLAIVPSIMLYVLLQKYFDNMAIGSGVKG